MKIVILAGGRGTRGKPFTDYFPKAMIPVKGRPLIYYLIKYVSKFEFINEIIVLSDFNGLGDQIRVYFQELKLDNKKIRYIQDSNSGTGGDLLHLSMAVQKDKDIILWFVDNFCALNLEKMYQFYKQKKCLACIATRNHRKEETGYAEIRDGLITRFQEKPIISLKLSECLGIYILNKKVLEIIGERKKEKETVNLSFDVLEDLAEKKQAYSFDIGNLSWIDIDSPNKVERDQELIEKIMYEMKVNK